VDECLVPWDFDWTPERAITDDDFLGYYTALPYGSRFVAIFDCCHAGGIDRAITRQFNVNVTKVVDSITVTPAPAIVVKLCDLRSGASALWLNRIAYTYNEVRVELRQNWINTAHHCYRIEQGDGG